MFLYKSAVIKHGSHNQKTHAGSRGGGAGGSGSGSAKKPSKGSEMSDTNFKTLANEMKSEFEDAKSDLGEGFATARNEGYQVKELQNLYRSQKRIDRAAVSIGKLKTAKTPEQRTKIIDDTIGHLDYAIDGIDSEELSNNGISRALTNLEDLRAQLNTLSPNGYMQ
jgi:hypothetical protein